MAGGFHNPIIGGGGSLVYPAIHSPDFVHLVSGWSINKDGTAEFQSIVIPSGSGGARIFVQASAPASPHAGDLWVQTASGNEVAQWSGSAWVSFQWGTGSIAANAITAALIAAHTITAAQIAAGTITATEIASHTITAAQIAAGTITATEIASHTITAAQIAAGTITATEIAAGTITAALLAAGIVKAGIVDGTTITGAELVIKNSHGAVIVQIDSTKDAIFVYADTGSASQGALLLSMAGASGTDPLDSTSYPQGVKIFAGVFEGTDYEVNSSGAFFYSSAPAAGNLIASIASIAGTDAFGNAYVAGLASYEEISGVINRTAQLLNGQANFLDPTASFTHTPTVGIISASSVTVLDSPAKLSQDHASIWLQGGSGGSGGRIFLWNGANGNLGVTVVGSLSLATVSGGVATNRNTLSLGAAPGYAFQFDHEVDITSGGLAVTGGTVTDTFASNAISGSAHAANPVGTVSASLVMMGLGAAATPWTFTPASSGKMHVTATVLYEQDTTNAGLTIGVRYGTGTAPANGAAVSGTRWGNSADLALTPWTVGASGKTPITFSDVIDLTAGTAYWLDIALSTSNAADKANVFNPSLTWVEVQ